MLDWNGQTEGFFTQKNPRTPPKKSEKSKDSSNSVFKSFFNHKIPVHQKKISKNPYNLHIKKSKGFFWGSKIPYLIWEWTTPRFQCLNPFLFIKSSYTQIKSGKKPNKIRKNLKHPRFFWEFKIRTTYSYGSEPLGTNVSVTFIPFNDKFRWAPKWDH